MKRITSLLLLIFVTCFTLTSAQTIKSPDQFFGFHPGSDGNLFTYEQLIEYLTLVDKASPKVQLEEIGHSPMGRPMYIAFVSSENNIANLSKYKEYNRKLALDSNLPKEERDQILEDGKVFVLVTLSMHSTEVGPTQASPIIIYDLATTMEREKTEWLENVVMMIVPNHNPDGMDLVVENYKKYKGTKYEGASLPSVYHKYVGHDNNRDFVILSQDDSKAIAAIYNKTWFPQVMVEKHQMGSSGVRYFVPPNHDPIAENIPASIFTWSGVFGQNMVNDMTNAGQAGVAQHYLFDDYWPGSTETCIWKNVIGFLTEGASAKIATPVYVEKNELSVSGKGLSEYKKSTNMLLPWEGGWWRLGDIVDYEIVSTLSVLKTASRHREEILTFRNDICRKMVEMGRSEPPYYYIMPVKQHDQGELVNLVNLLREHGITLYQLEKEMVINSISYEKGDIVVPLAQPFRSFIKEVMEAQEFPERHYTPDGALIQPYDITTWSLPLHRQVKSFEINTRSASLEANIAEIDGEFSLAGTISESAVAVILPAGSNESYRAAFMALEQKIPVQRLKEELMVDGVLAERGSFLIRFSGKSAADAKKLVANLKFQTIPFSTDITPVTSRITVPRIALIETYFHDMDAGWTRFLFDIYHVPYTVLHPDEVAKADMQKKFDILIFPDDDKNILLKGKYKSGDEYYMANYHPDFVKGLEKEGLEEVLKFINKGGHVLAWGRSTSLFEGSMSIKEGNETEEFRFPFKDISAVQNKKGLSVPGSLMKIEVDRSAPLALGMPAETGVFSRGGPLFRTSQPGFEMDRRVIASYPEKDILLSGYAAKEELMGNSAAMVVMQKGQGELVVYGFNPQFRASTQSTYKLLFNAILFDDQGEKHK